MSVPLFAEIVPDFQGMGVRVLASVGAGALGGFLVGWLAAVVARTYFAHTIPPRLAWFVRTLAFVACGLITWGLMGPKGLGDGPGGWWTSGPGNGGDRSANKDDGKDPKRDGEKRPVEKDKKGPGTEALTVEVLGDPTLERLNKDKVKSFDRERRYRVTGKAELLTLEEVKTLVEKASEGEPPLLQLEILLRGDHPPEEFWVEPLEKWAKDLARGRKEKAKGRKLEVKVSKV